MIYTVLSTSTVNPLELERDIEDFHNYINEKYGLKATRLSFIDWVRSKLNK